MRPTSRRDFLKTSMTAGAALAAPSSVYSQSTGNRPPNLLFVFPDQMRPKAMGFMKEDPVLTSALYFAPFYPPSDGHRHGGRGVRTERYTMVIRTSKEGEPQQWLFDNVEDPCQLKNLAGDRPDLMERLLREELMPWLEKIGDPWLGCGSDEEGGTGVS